MTRRDNNPCKDCILFALCQTRFNDDLGSNTIWELIYECPFLEKYLNNQVEEEHGYGVGLINSALAPKNGGYISLDIPFSYKKSLLTYGRVLEEV